MANKADFSIDVEALKRRKEQGGMRLLCQNLMPGVNDGKYDYYELLTVMLEYMNDNMAATIGISEQFDKLQEFTNMIANPKFEVIGSYLYVTYDGLNNNERIRLGYVKGDTGEQGPNGLTGDIAGVVDTIASFQWNIDPETGMLSLTYEYPNGAGGKESATQDVGKVKELVTPVDAGGTGAVTPAEALANLGITISSQEAPETGVPGSVYLQLL